MIISLSTDQSVVNGTRHLCKLYPEESHMCIETIFNRNFSLASVDETDVQRIIFLGHSDDNISYGGLTAREFAALLINIFKTNEELSPGFIENIQAIDLLGCQLGQVENIKISFAYIVSEQLQNAGYEIPIYALNLNNEMQEKINKTKLRNALTHWEFYGVKSSEDMTHHNILLKQYVNLRDEIDAKKAELYEIIERLKNMRNDPMPSPTEVEMQDELVLQRKQLKHEIRQLEKKIDKVVENVGRLKVVIAEFTDPREYFSNHAECNFSSLVANARKFQTQKIYKSALAREKVENDQHPLAVTREKRRN